MMRPLQLIFSPFRTWMKIVADQRSIGFILFASLIPLVVVCVGVESYSLVHWGEQRGEWRHLVPVAEPVAVRYATISISLFLACVFFGAFGLQAVARSFNLPATFRQALTAIAYGISPIVLMRLADAIPAINTWVCWGIGALLSISVLYHGVALTLKPEQTKGFGLYLVSVMIVLLSTGVAHFVALAVLHEKVFR